MKDNNLRCVCEIKPIDNAKKWIGCIKLKEGLKENVGASSNKKNFIQLTLWMDSQSY